MIFITSTDDVKDDKLIFLYFYANWLPLHKKMLLMLDKIEKKYNNSFYAIDTDSFKEYCKRAVE